MLTKDVNFDKYSQYTKGGLMSAYVCSKCGEETDDPYKDGSTWIIMEYDLDVRLSGAMKTEANETGMKSYCSLSCWLRDEDHG